MTVWHAGAHVGAHWQRRELNAESDAPDNDNKETR